VSGPGPFDPVSAGARRGRSARPAPLAARRSRAYKLPASRARISPPKPIGDPVTLRRDGSSCPPVPLPGQRLRKDDLPTAGFPRGCRRASVAKSGAGTYLQPARGGSCEQPEALEEPVAESATSGEDWSHTSSPDRPCLAGNGSITRQGFRDKGDLACCFFRTELAEPPGRRPPRMEFHQAGVSEGVKSSPSRRLPARAPRLELAKSIPCDRRPLFRPGP